MLLQLLANALITGSLYALAAAGMTLTYIAFRILNFAHGTLIMLGAYLFYFCLGSLQLPVLLSIFIIALMAALLAPLLRSIFIAPFSKQHALLPFVSTLALSIFLESIVSMIAGVDVRSFPTDQTSNSNLLFSAVYITDIQIQIIVATLSLLLVLALWIRYSPFGVIMRALSEAPTYLYANGCNVVRYQLLIFSAALFLCFLCGYFLGLETNLQPLMGSSIMIKAFAAMIAGGMTSVFGAILAAYFLAIIESLGIGLDMGAFSIPASYRDSISLVIILVVLLVRPNGITAGKGRAV